MLSLCDAITSYTFLEVRYPHLLLYTLPRSLEENRKYDDLLNMKTMRVHLGPGTVCHWRFLLLSAILGHVTLTTQTQKCNEKN